MKDEKRTIREGEDVLRVGVSIVLDLLLDERASMVRRSR
jgi:hypothetical protein